MESNVKKRRLREMGFRFRPIDCTRSILLFAASDGMLGVRAGLIIILVMGAGFVTRPCQASPKDVRVFGAQGNGTTDDTRAFAKAVQGAGDVYVPPGDYLVKEIVLPDNAYLHGAGAGSTIILSSGGGTISLGHHCRISNLCLTGQDKNEGKVATQLDKALITIRGSEKNGIVPKEGVTLDHLQIGNYTHTGICTNHAMGLRIQDCHFEKLNLAVLVQFSQRVHISGCRVSDTAKHGIQFWGNWQWERMGCEDLTITDNYVKNGGEGAIFCTGAKRVIVANNVVDGAKDVGIDLEWCVDSTISGNTVRNCENACISLFFACERVSITGNTVINDRPITNPKANWWARAGIWLTNPNQDVFKVDHGHRDITIVGNTIHCAEGDRRAMWIGVESENVTITGNTLRGGLIWRGDPPAADKEPRTPASAP